MSDADKEKEFRARFEAEQAPQETEEERAFRERFQQDVAEMQDQIVNPAYGVIGGAVLGYPIGRAVRNFQEGASKKPAMPAPEMPAPSAGPRVDGGNAVENWAKTQHAGEFYGGKDYAGAHQRAMNVKQAAAESPGMKPMQGTGLIAPREAVEDFEAKRAAAEKIQAERNKPFAQRFVEQNPKMGAATSGVANVLRKGFMPFAERVGAGGFGGYQAVDAYNRAKQGDVAGATIGGAGAAGALSTLSSNPKTRALGAVTSILAEIINRNRNPGIIEPGTDFSGVARDVGDLIFNPSAETPVPGYAKGKRVKAGLESLAEKFGYDPKRIAKQYPEVAPPVMTTDPRTGKTFAQKQLSPEALAVQKARQAAQKEIDKGMMTAPFFDISKRAYVDPTNYPLQGRTLTDQVPKKAATREKYELLAESPEATERLLSAYRRGDKAPLAKDWYAMKQLEDEFVKELGPDAGRQAFRQRFAEPMAATTGGADPTSNLMMTAYSNYMDTAGKTLPTAAFELPFPVGGRFVSGNMEQANKYRQMGAIPIDNPKRHNFASNFMGYRDRPTIDEQMMGLFAPGKGAPEPGTYGVYEAALNKLAAQEGVNPVNFQDVAWAGAKNYQGKPMMQEINEMIYRTSRITGESPEEVLKGFIRGNKPMYNITGLGALGAATEGVNNPE